MEKLRKGNAFRIERQKEKKRGSQLEKGGANSEGKKIVQSKP